MIIVTLVACVVFLEHASICFPGKFVIIVNVIYKNIKFNRWFVTLKQVSLFRSELGFGLNKVNSIKVFIFLSEGS